jgi:hypothetical protein
LQTRAPGAGEKPGKSDRIQVNPTKKMKPVPKSREGLQFEGFLQLSMGAGFE